MKVKTCNVFVPLKLGVVFFLAFTSFAYAASLVTKDVVLPLFAKANFSYKEGKYKDAVTYYEEILKGGWESGAIYYNLGNSYLKLGKVGLALLNYERAQALTPRDGDLKSNYNYALSLANAFVSNEGNKPLLGRWLDKIVNQFSVNELAAFFFAMILFTCVVHLLAMFLPWKPKRFARVLVFCLCLCLCALFAIFLKEIKYNDAGIIIEETQCKFEPRTEATNYFELFEGMKIKIIKQEGLWLKIKRADGKLGWVLKRYVEKI